MGARAMGFGGGLGGRLKLNFPDRKLTPGRSDSPKLPNTMQCAARLTVERGNIPSCKFSNKPRFGFFLPKRCDAFTAGEDGFCEPCRERWRKVPERLAKWGGSMQNQSDQVHGRYDEPLPEWSRIYGSTKIQDLMAKGYEITDETRQAAEEAVAQCLGTKEMPARAKPAATEPSTEPVAEKPKAKRAPRKEKVAAAEAAPEPAPTPALIAPKKRAAPKKAVAAAEPAPAPVPVAAPPAPVAPKKRPAPKKAVAVQPAPATQQPTPLAVVKETLPADEVTIVEVRVRRIEIDGRTFLLSSEKDKVYDLKYNYVGRYDRASDAIVSTYPDSESD